jgi:hypothetical protein
MTTSNSNTAMYVLIPISIIESWVISKYMEFEIPESLELEHEELHRQLVNAVKEGDKIGEAA